MKEPLAQFHTKDGKTIDMHREEGDVVIASEDHRVVVSQATGQQTLDWIAFLEGLTEKAEYPEGEGND